MTIAESEEYGLSRITTMAAIEFDADAVQIDAAIIGEGFGLDPSAVQSEMRRGKLTSMCERGVDRDAGRYRLTFYYKGQRFRLVVGEAGNVIERSAVGPGDPSKPKQNL